MGWPFNAFAVRTAHFHLEQELGLKRSAKYVEVLRRAAEPPRGITTSESPELLEPAQYDWRPLNEDAAQEIVAKASTFYDALFNLAPKRNFAESEFDSLSLLIAETEATDAS